MRELLLVRGWDRISVQHLCTRADIGRSTFYMHYPDKEALLRSSFDELAEQLLRQLAPGADRHGSRVVVARFMIEHVDENRRLFRAIVGKRSGLAVQAHFRRVLLELFMAELSAVAHIRPRLEPTAHYVAGAFFELLVWWHGARDPLPAAEVVALFHRLTDPVIAAR